MIKLKLSFGENEPEKNFDIVDGELLQEAVERATQEVPKGQFELKNIFNVVVNGEIVESDFWGKIKLQTKDDILITPKIQSGESGQIFKQILIIGISIAAVSIFPPAAGLGSALLCAGITIGATLALNALIPPPVPNLGEVGGGLEVESSQMYSISGQSNQARRLGVVPKVYGSHRMFPPLAANPYTELAVDPRTGEMIQYLVAVYDFGLGTPAISDLKIGDTPLVTESFEDFQYNFVDPNRPEVAEDEFDEDLQSEFKLYKGDRTVTQLSLALEDGEEAIQNTDENPDSLPQELVLDLICPSGLYGYSSEGNIGNRRILLNLDFAPVGTSDWKSYNDMSAVDGFRTIGGTDYTDYTFNPVFLAPNHTLFATYYAYTNMRNATYNSPQNVDIRVYIKPSTNVMLVPKPTASQLWTWDLGTRVMVGGVSKGTITAITDLAPTYPSWVQITLSSDIATPVTSRNGGGFGNNGAISTVFAYSWTGAVTATAPGVVVLSGSSKGSLSCVGTRHTLGAVNLLGSSSSPVYTSIRFTPKVAAQYKVRLRRVSTTGSYTRQTADAITWGALTTSFNQIPVRTTLRHVFLELKIRATNQLNGQIQNLSAIVSQPLPVYDSVSGTWTREVTCNPAWVFCDLLTGEVNKKAVPDSRLHMESIVAWAEYCDEIPTPPPSQTYLEPRFQCNFILDYNSTLQEVLNQVTGSAQASLNIIDGKYGVLVDKFKTTPVQIFTARNSRDFSSSRFYPPQPHALKIKYIDPQLAWEITECIVYDDGYDEETATEFEEMTSFACTNYEQAWRFGRYMLAQNKLRQETISILVDFENLICTRGDYVQIAHDVMQVGGRPARVKEVAGDVVTVDDGFDIDPGLDYGYTYRSSIGEINTDTCTPLTARTFQLDGDMPAVGDLIVIGEVGSLVLDCIVKSISPNDDLSAQVTLIERANEIFDYESSSELPVYDPQLSVTSSPDFRAPNAVTDFVVSDNFWECNALKSGYNYYVELVWEIPAGSVYDNFEVWVNDGRGYRMHTTTTAKMYRYDVDQTRLDIEHGFKVVAVSASGKKLELIAMPEVTCTPATKVTPPSDVESLNMSITNQVLQLSWPQIADCDCAKYHIRFSPESNDVWESSIKVAEVAGSVSSTSVQARTGVYLIKAIDFNDNQSESAAIAITTIPNLFDLNVVETVNDAPAFDGQHVETELLGEAVVLKIEEDTGDPATMAFFEEGYYESENLLDLDDVFTVRLQSQIRADGYKFGELMADWESLEDVEDLNSATSDDWNVDAEYRATDSFAAMADWVRLDLIDHINFGAGIGFTDWRPIPTIGDATGRIFQFRYRLQSLSPNVTPRLFDASIKADMPDRTDSFENLVSTALDAYVVTYANVFKGPGTSPNVQISVDNGQTGDYWSFDYKSLEGFAIRFFNQSGTQVSRQFDVQAKGYGRRHTATI